MHRCAASVLLSLMVLFVGSCDEPLALNEPEGAAPVQALSNVTSAPTSGPTLIFADPFPVPQGGWTGVQCETGNTVYAATTIEGWTGSGFHATHAVEWAPGRIAASFFDGGELLMNTGIAANEAGVLYAVSFVGGPSVWEICDQATGEGDGILVEVVRADGSVLAWHPYYPPTWSGASSTLSPTAFGYVGDGSGPVRLRFRDNNDANVRFGGAIGDVRVYEHLVIVAPGAGAVHRQGETVTVHWGGGEPDWNVNVSVISEALNQVIASVAGDVPNTGSAEWIVPSDLAPGRYRLYVENTARTQWRYGEYFTVVPVISMNHEPLVGIGQHGYLSLSLPEAATIDIPVSIENRNTAAFVAQPGAANRTYGGQTGTYVVPAGIDYMRLYIIGESVGPDTLIMTVPGQAPDTAAFDVRRGLLSLPGWPDSLRVGDSAQVSVLPLTPDGSGAAGLAFAHTFTLEASDHLVLTAGGSEISSVQARFGTGSPPFYVKAIAAGSATLTPYSPDYEPFTASVEITPSGATPIGAGVEVAPTDETTGEPAPTTLSFESVTSSGTTTVSSGTVGDASAPAPTSAEYKLGQPPTYYDISTTATFSGSVQVCIDYTGASYGNETQLKLLHYEAGIWVDITDPGYPDTTNNIICGTSTSLSPFLVAESNLAPVVTGIQLPLDPVAVHTSVSISAPFTDENTADVHTALIDWEVVQTAGAVAESGGAGVVTGSYAFSAPGVYTVEVTVDDDGLSGTRSSSADIPAYVVVYDPSAGFVTGGGWIPSPAGACAWSGCALDGSTTGKATFGFVSRYRAGATTPDGNTEFQFRAGDLEFRSVSHQWLVVAGDAGKFKGEGTINGAGSYGFMITAIDGESGDGGPDRFRIKIWDKMNGDAVVYDNQMGASEDSDASTTLGGGSIVIHK